jgi:vacuolar iron transporter family protein
VLIVFYVSYFQGRSEIDHYDAERARESNEVKTVPLVEEQEIIEIFEPYGMCEEDIQPLLCVLRNDHETWVDFMVFIF